MIARWTSVFAVALACAIPAVCGPIHRAAATGKVAKVVALLQAHPELVSSVDSVGNTPLHLAALHNQLEVAKVLIANGADVNALSNRSALGTGMRPLHAALLSYQHKEMLELLISRGADVNAGDDFKATPLHYAARGDLRSDAELLLANGAEINSQDKMLATPLHWAIRANHFEMVKLLVTNDAAVNVISGCTPLTLALSLEKGSDRDRIFDYTKIASFLRSHGGYEGKFGEPLKIPRSHERVEPVPTEEVP